MGVDRRAPPGRLPPIPLSRRDARGVIASLSSSAADIAAALGIPIDRIAVVPPYVRRLGRDARPAGRGGRTTVPGAFIFVGVLEPHKRPELAIAAIAALVRRGDATRALTFVAGPAGATPRGARAPRRRHGACLTGSGSWSSPMTTSSTRCTARGTLLATSRIEGFGQPPVEAILSGGRVVAVPIAAYRETVGGLATFASECHGRRRWPTPRGGTDDPPTLAARASLAAGSAPLASTAALRAAYDRFGAR